MMGRHSTRDFVKLSFETESPGAPDRGHKTFRRRPLVIQFSRSLPPPTSRVCGQLARSCCAPAVTDRGDPQTSPASPRVRSPSPPEPGDPGVPRREGRRAPAPGPGYPGGGEHRGPLSPPLGPPGTRSLAKCRGLASEPPSRPLAHPPVLTVAAASSRRPSFQAAPASSGAANTHRPARPLASPRLPVHPRPLAGHAPRSSAGHALQTTPPGVCAWPGAEPGPRPRAFWSAATCWTARLWLQRMCVLATPSKRALSSPP